MPVMHRRELLLTSGAAGLGLCALRFTGALASATPEAVRTRWEVRTSEGLDALCFLGPLSGDPFYASYYRDELSAFVPKLKAETIATIMRLFKDEQARGGLLGPDLCLLFSGGPTATLDDLMTALNAADTILKPPYAASPYWDSESWDTFLHRRNDLLAVLSDMRAAGFSGFWHDCIDKRATVRIPALRAKLASLDTIAEQERLLGRKFADPTIEVILLYFSQPHGIRIQGMRFLTYIDYPDWIVIRNADHEPMHPPFDKDDARMKTVLALLSRDELLNRIVKEHDKRFGYNSLEGLIDEDTVQALEQIVNERLGVAEDPAKRWTESDDGIHIFAAGLYGLLKAQGYDRTGGNIEQWLYAAAQNGTLAPPVLHAAAARVLKRDAENLWPGSAPR